MHYCCNKILAKFFPFNLNVGFVGESEISITIQDQSSLHIIHVYFLQFISGDS